MKARKSSAIATILILLAALLFGQNQLCAAVGFSLTPPAISNTYPGKIILQINGLTNGGSVVVQKYLDANSNGVVDAGDLLMQQFNLTDGQGGMVIGGVTNLNVPGDTDGAANGAIAAKLFLRDDDFFQTTIGQYLFVVSSPTSAFTPVTNTFLITNVPYGQQLTGTVVSNGTSTVIPGALVTIFPPPRQGHNGPGTPLASTVANNAGVYTVQLPPGSYMPMAFAGGYVGNFGTASLLTLSNGQTLNVDLTLSNATSTISGSFVDMNSPATGLPGVLSPVMTDSGLIAAGSTDSNGNFTVGVTPAEVWSVGSYAPGLISLGYVGFDNSPTNVNSGASGVTVGFVKGNALFYGTVLDNLGNSIPGLSLEARDSSSIYDEQGSTDKSGNYALAAVGGLGSNDTWQVNIQTGDGGIATSYVFSQPTQQQFNLGTGQAVQVNFTGILATNTISGHVQDSSNNPIAGVGVFATLNTSNGFYQTSTVDTDSNGDYTLAVANSNVWSVNLLYCCNNDSLSHINPSYQLPPSDNVGVTNNTGIANFTVQFCTGPQITTTNLPAGTANSFYMFNLQGSTCNGTQFWSLNDPQDFPNGMSLFQNGQISGTPQTNGTFNFSVQLSDGNSNFINQSLSLIINPGTPPLQVSTGFLPNGTNGNFYSQNLQASGGVQPYNWSLANGSASLPPNLTLSTNGLLSGTPVVSGTNFQFIVQVMDASNNVATRTLSLSISGGSGPLQITTASLPNGNNGLFYNYNLQATGGQPPYTWSLAAGSANPPANLALGTNGILSGTPVVSGTNFQFIAQVTDSAFNSIQRVMSLTITGSATPPPVSLDVVSQPGSGQLQFNFNTVSGVKYSIQSSADLKHWNTELSFTGSGGQETVGTPTTGASTFYRVKVGP